MARKLRFKPIGEDIYYHLFSRTVGQEFYLEQDYEKQFFLDLLIKYSSIFFVDLISFCIMDNHFHIVVKSVPKRDYTDKEINRRIHLLTDKEYNKVSTKTLKNKNDNSRDLNTISINFEDYTKYCSKLEDISEFMKRIKESYSIWYNKNNDRTGTLWGERFKDVLLEPGQSLLWCCTYIELNPVRANMIDRPDIYKWNSMYARVNKTQISKLLSFTGMYDEKTIGTKKCLEWYRKYVFISGGIQRGLGQGCIKKEILEMEERYGYKLLKNNVFIKKIRQFTDGTAVGSASHIKEFYNAIVNNSIKVKKDRGVYSISGITGLFSMRRLKKTF